MQGRGHSCSPRRRKRVGRGGGGGYGLRLGGPLGLLKNRLDLRKTILYLLRSQDEWRQEAQDAFVRSIDEEGLLERLRVVWSAIRVHVHNPPQFFCSEFPGVIQ